MNDGPVLVHSWTQTKDPKVINVKFVQQCIRPIKTNAAMRKVFMQGHESFGPMYDIRVAWTIMTLEAWNSLKLAVRTEFPEAWRPRIVAVEFCDGEPIPVELRDLYKEEVFYHKTWHTPKIIPGGKELTYKGLPIYRDNHLMIGDVHKEDYLKIAD